MNQEIMTEPEIKKALQLSGNARAAYFQEVETARIDNAKIGDGITRHLWSDSHACTVIKRSAKRMILQRDEAILKADSKPKIIPGGFSGHCVNNNTLEYDYKRDMEGQTYTIYKDKNGVWRDSHLKKKVSFGRYEKYDYNF